MEAPAGSRPKKQNRKLGPGVSLAKFGAGKRATYDPRREKERERALNAAKVNKLKKLKRRLGDKLEPSFKLPQADDNDQGEQQVQQDAAADEAAAQDVQHQQNAGSIVEQRHGGNGRGGGRGRGERGRSGGRGGRGSEGLGRGRKHKPVPHVQRIAAEVQAEKEARQREREERQRAAAERAAKLAADVKRRAAESKLLFKKTGHGQPVMKHRVDKILAQLQRQ